MRYFIFTWLTALVFLSSCMSFNLTRKNVLFFDPSTTLAVSQESTDKTHDKILLRFAIPQNNELKYVEKTQIFMQIENDTGLETEFTRRIVETYKDSGKDGVMIVKNESSLLENPDVTSVEEFEMTPQGEILRCIYGLHKSKEGEISITEWKRSPVFPQEPVAPGDTWTYTESIKMKLDSFWVSRKNDSPETLTATSTFTGYATVNGKPCAVIESRTKQRKRETIGAFFKTIIMDVTVFGTDKLYFDYKAGVVIGMDVRAKIFSLAENGGFSDYTESQTIVTPSPQ